MMTSECAANGEVKFPLPSEGFEGGHAVLFCGHDDSKEIGFCKGAFMFANSWSESWGWGGGYGWLPYKYLVEGLADDFWSLRTEQLP